MLILTGVLFVYIYMIVNSGYGNISSGIQSIKRGQLCFNSLKPTILRLGNHPYVYF